MTLGVNDKKMVLHFEDPQEAIDELYKLSSGAKNFLSYNGEIIEIKNVKDFLISVIIDCDYEYVKRSDK